MTTRLEGLDLARALALCAMVLVNFHLAMGAPQGQPGWLTALFSALEGRSAATFVMLAGVGLGLGTRRMAWGAAAAHTARRGLFLLGLGLLNVLLFPADILHYYGVYFLLAALCLRLPSSLLVMLAMGLADLFVTLIFLFDYQAGWRWADLSYPEFWQPVGFARNLLFNGWHPVVPWFAFLLAGLWLSRQPLGERRTQWRMVLGGSLAALLAKGSSLTLSALFPAWASLFALAPLPPLPLYLLFAGGAACALIGLCLLLMGSAWRPPALGLLLPMGRQSLTLYMAHILLGMGALEALGWLQGKAPWQVLLAALLYLLAAALFARQWERRFGRGPLERLMRRLCDRRTASPLPQRCED